MDNISNEHPVMKYLIDKPYRAKMEAIIQALDLRKLTSHVNLGCGRNAIGLDIVGEMLSVTGR